MDNEANPDRPDQHEEQHVLITPPRRDVLLPYLAALAASEIPYRIIRDEQGWQIQVHADDAEDAIQELQEYERVNRNWPPAGSSEMDAETDRTAASEDCIIASITAVTVLLLFYLQTGPYDAEQNLFVVGRAVADNIKSGEWWRPFTALTLHSDMTHVLGNAAALLLFGTVLSQQLGFGIGWFALAASGAGGNVLSAMIKYGDTPSVGASTSVFASLGLLTVFQLYRNFRRHGFNWSIWNRTWLPAAAGVAFLTLLSAGTHTDFVAHLSGFVIGAIGALVLLPWLSSHAGFFLQAVMYLAMYGIFWYSWRTALGR